MGGSFALVSRSPLSASQKLVQARMYAQGSTLAVLLASFAVEANDATKGKGRWETIKIIDPNDPEHKHLIEKRIHHERYPGEDQWRGMSLVSSGIQHRELTSKQRWSKPKKKESRHVRKLPKPKCTRTRPRRRKQRLHNKPTAYLSSATPDLASLYLRLHIDSISFFPTLD